MHQRICTILVMGFVLFSCNKDSKLETEISKIETNLVIERFDKAFLEAQPKDLPQLKKAYPFLFPQRVPDSVWVKKLNDTLEVEILQEVNKTFEDFKDVKSELVSLFQHIKYYDKVFSEPRVVTLTNRVQHRDKIIVTDSIALIALDNYLGEHHKFYVNGNIASYLAANFNKEQIVVNMAEDYAKKYAFQTNRKTLLDEMIYFGKLLYFKDVMIPFKTDAEKIGYTEEQMQWSEANESPIWSYFIEKELLFSTDPKLPSRFLVDAPYSKFGLELDNKSPGRLGQYIGWQIVKAYAEKTDEDVLTIMQIEPEVIFNIAKFKPKK